MRKVFSLFIALCLTASLAMAQNASTSGSLTAPAQAVTLSLDNYGSVAVQVTGTWTGTLQFEGSVNGTDYFALSGTNFSSQASASSATANGQFSFGIPGITSFRVRASALGSGTANVSVVAGPYSSQVNQTVVVASALPAGNSNIGDVDVASIAAGNNNIGDVDVASSALPTGASTSALQTTGNTSLSNIDGKLPSVAAPSDGLSNPSITKIQTFGMVWNAPANQWDRMNGSGLGGDSIVPSGTGNVSVRGFNLGWNGTNWDRVSVSSANGDGVTPASIGNLQTRSFMQSFNGSTFDRVRSGGTNADDVATTTVGALNSRGFNYLWDGTTWDRMPGTSTDGTLVNLGANNDVTVSGTVAVSSVAGTVAITTSDPLSVQPPTEDNDAFVANTSKVQAGAFVADSDGTVTDVTTGNLGAARMTEDRIQLFALMDPANHYISNVNSNGAVQVYSTETDPVEVTGNFCCVSPADNASNPAGTAIQSTSFGMTWDTLNSQWNRLRGQTNTLPSGAGVTSFGGYNQLYNGSTWDWAVSATNGLNSVGTGLTAASFAAQFDDVSPTSITENRFGNVRMSQNRNLYGTIRDAAGNERGANVTASNALVVDGSAVTQPVSFSGALPAGNNNIGDVDVASIAAGNNNIGDVDVASLPALPAGTNNIGDVDVLTLPSIPAGTNNIGDVDVLTVPADPFGANADAAVAAGASGSIQAKLRRLTQGVEDLKTLTVIAAGNNNIGDVDVASIAAGNNNIGDVDVASLPAVMTDRTQKTQLTDGTRDGTIKAASTAAVAADTSFVVALSPNSPLPTGSNAIGKLAANSGVDIGDVDITSIAAGNNNIGDVDIASFPDNEPFNLNQIAGNAVSTGVGASGTGTLRTASLIHDGTNTAQVTSTSGGSLQVECTSGCGSAATANLINFSVNESVAAPTATTWYIKRRWALPASAHFTPTRVWSTVTTAGSRTLIGIANKMGSLNVSTNTFTDANSVSSPRSYGRLIGCVSTTMSATANTVTVTYNDNIKGAARTTAALSIPSAAPAGNCFEFQTAAGTGLDVNTRDSAVLDITNITDSAAPTGVIDVYGFTAMQETLGVANAFEQSTYDAAAEMSSTEELWILFQQAATTAQQRGAGVSGTIR